MTAQELVLPGDNSCLSSTRRFGAHYCEDDACIVSSFVLHTYVVIPESSDWHSDDGLCMLTHRG
jgi:hypothetical protein